VRIKQTYYLQSLRRSGVVYNITRLLFFQHALVFYSTYIVFECAAVTCCSHKESGNLAIVKAKCRLARLRVCDQIINMWNFKAKFQAGTEVQNGKETLVDFSAAHCKLTTELQSFVVITRRLALSANSRRPWHLTFWPQIKWMTRRCRVLSTCQVWCWYVHSFCVIIQFRVGHGSLLTNPTRRTSSWTRPDPTHSYS